MENTLLPKDEIVILMIIGTVSMLSLALFILLIFYAFQRKILSQKIKEEEKLLYHTIHVQESEKLRISQELHDEIGSKLNLMHLHLYQLSTLRSQEGEFFEAYARIKEILNKSIESAREIAHDLMPPTLENAGFFAAVRELCEEVENTGLINIHVDLKIDQRDVLKREMELDLFRVVQELLTNSIKHASAKNIMIESKMISNRLIFYYKDDGKGFDKSLIAQNQGLGMKNIENRLKMIGATWQFKSANNEGMSIKIFIKNVRD